MISPFRTSVTCRYVWLRTFGEDMCLTEIPLIRPVDLPFIQEEMMLCWLSGEMARRIDNNTIVGFLTDGHDLRDTIVKVWHPKNLYRSSVKRQPVITNVAQISETFVNKKCHQAVFKVLSSKPTLSRISKLHFKVDVECRKSDVESVIYRIVIDRIE